MTTDLPPAFVLAAFRDLQRRQFGLGPADLVALRTALRAGFGLQSDRELTELCVALWATTPSEAEVVRAVFARHEAPSWDVTRRPTGARGDPEGETAPRPRAPDALPPTTVAVPPPVSDPSRGLPPLPELPTTTRTAVFASQYPLTRRAVAQAVRRLRRPVAVGPPTQLDVAATVARRARLGVATPPVLVPRRRNLARLLLLVDRQGSMAPFHPYIDHVRDAVVDDGGLERVEVAYFHDTPADRPDHQVVRRLRGPVPSLDPVLDAVEPSLAGTVFDDPALLDPLPLNEVVGRVESGAGVILLSDAGAARGRLDPARTLGAIAFVRALRAGEHRVVWLNPMPKSRWSGSSAAQLARHVPMVTLDAPGLHQAIDVLRGRPMPLARAA